VIEDRDDGNLDQPADLVDDVQPLARWSLPEPTGVDDVDEALAVLADLDGLPTAEHVAVYDTVHKQLQDSLADLDGRRPG
jgi:hypothetical protein